LESALQALAGREPDAHVASVVGQLARFLQLSGEYERAAPYVEQSLALAEALDLPEALSHALNNKGVLAAHAGRLNEARVLLEGALAIALENDLNAAAIRAYNNLAWALEAQDRLPETLAVTERAIEHARRIGDRAWEVGFLGSTLYTLYLRGEWDEALELAQRLADEVTVQAQLSVLDAIHVHAARGELGQARAWWERFTSALGPADDPQTIASSRVLEARLLRAEGSTRDALALADDALAYRDQLGSAHVMVKLATEELLENALALDDRARAREVLAVLDGLRPGELTPRYRAIRARFRGRLAEGPAAAASFREAEQVYESLEARFMLAVTQLEHAEALSAEGAGEESETLRAAAHAVFEHLRARPWLERAAALDVGATAATAPA
jgi:tetratricopeptide (TPR) repeat protein